jgi:hypothetical protein
MPSFDTTGNVHNSSSATITATATSATMSSGEFGFVYWATQNSNPTGVAASGWTASTNYTYNGTFTQVSIGSGVTASAAITGLQNAGTNSACLITLAP